MIKLISVIKKEIGIILILVLTVNIHANNNLPIDLLEEISFSVAKITTTKLFYPKKEGTGFLWGRNDEIVTAYHLIAGGYDGITIKFSKANISLYNADVYIKKVFKEADLVLLGINKQLDGLIPLSSFSESNISIDEDLYVIGYALGMDISLTRTLTGLINQNITFKDMLNSNLSDNLNGFNMEMEILPHQEGLLPGDSGAPILNNYGELVGIGHGGYHRHGGVEICWSIPASNLSALANSNDIIDVLNSNSSTTFWYGWSPPIIQEKIDSVLNKNSQSFPEINIVPFDNKVSNSFDNQVVEGIIRQNINLHYPYTSYSILPKIQITYKYIDVIDNGHGIFFTNLYTFIEIVDTNGFVIKSYTLTNKGSQLSRETAKLDAFKKLKKTMNSMNSLFIEIDDIMLDYSKN